MASPRGEGGLLTGLWHGDPAYRYLRDIPAWRRGLLTGLWHSDPAHRYLRGIPAWRTASRPVHDWQLTDALAGLCHGDPAHRYLKGIPVWRTASRSVHNRSLSDALVVLPALARDLHRAGSPCLQASQRQIALLGEAIWASPSKRICPTPTCNGFRFARCFARRVVRQPASASTSPTDTSVASPRGEEGF